MDRRLKVWREMNPSVDVETHMFNFFKGLIGEKNCKLLNVPDTVAENELKTLASIQKLLEQNGKPCCVNLITENDKKHLK